MDFIYIVTGLLLTAIRKLPGGVTLAGPLADLTVRSCDYSDLNMAATLVYFAVEYRLQSGHPNDARELLRRKVNSIQTGSRDPSLREFSLVTDIYQYSQLFERFGAKLPEDILENFCCVLETYHMAENQPIEETSHEDLQALAEKLQREHLARQFPETTTTE